MVQTNRLQGVMVISLKMNDSELVHKEKFVDMSSGRTRGYTELCSRNAKYLRVVIMLLGVALLAVFGLYLVFSLDKNTDFSLPNNMTSMGLEYVTKVTEEICNKAKTDFDKQDLLFQVCAQIKYDDLQAMQDIVLKNLELLSKQFLNVSAHVANSDSKYLELYDYVVSKIPPGRQVSLI